MPSLSEEAKIKTMLTVMTFNTGNDFISPDALQTLIQKSGADVVGLQELSPRNAAALDSWNAYPHRVLHGKHFDGKGLLSRYPIHTHELFTLRVERPHIEAEIHVDGTPVRVFVVHLPAPNYRRLETYSPHCEPELSMLLERRRDLPTLYMGDFNFIDQSATYRLMVQAGFKDTFRAAGKGRGPTFPTRFQYAYVPLVPVLRLDYIWASPHFEPRRSYVGQGYGSDHLPVISQLEIHSKGEKSR